MSILKGLAQYIKERHAEAPSTSSTLFAHFRQGLKDLQDIILNPFPDSHKSRDEPGTAANPPIQTVYRERENISAKQPTIKDLETGSSKTPETKQPEREKSREPELG